MDDAPLRYEICDLLCRTMVEVPPPGFGITVPSGNASLTASANAAEFIVSLAERITLAISGKGKLARLLRQQKA